MKAASLLPLVGAGLMAAFIVGVILLADTSNLGALRQVYAFPYGDKAGHFVLYGVLSLLLNLALLRLKPAQEPWRLAALGSLGLALIVSLEELSQVWMPSRTPDWFDLVASYAGITAFAALAVASTGRSHRDSRVAANR